MVDDPVGLGPRPPGPPTRGTLRPAPSCTYRPYNSSPSTYSYLLYNKIILFNTQCAVEGDYAGRLLTPYPTPYSRTGLGRLRLCTA